MNDPGPEQEQSRHNEKGSEPIQWQKNDDNEVPARESRDVETDKKDPPAK
jgi:hypothetical protein